jgi:hypothetical protein
MADGFRDGFFEASARASNGLLNGSLGTQGLAETARTIGPLSTEVFLPSLRPGIAGVRFSRHFQSFDWDRQMQKSLDAGAYS